MRKRSVLFRTSVFAIAATTMVFVACGGGSGSGSHFGSDGGSGGSSGGVGDASLIGDVKALGMDAMLLGEGDFGNDPPPPWCGMGPDPDSDAGVYGSLECPSDKNREGCPCSPGGTTAACWTGLRADRGIGVCKDGVTTCIHTGEGPLEWGPCVGEVLPTADVDAGAPACKCFSTGTWAITNVEPCLGEDGMGGYTGAVSTWIDGTGAIQCPSNLTSPPTPQPGTTWSPDSIKVDCAGSFTLCYTIRVGDPKNPQATDCVVGQACTMGYVPTANVVATLPALPAWQGEDVACANLFATGGGYGEMSVYGESVRCETVGSMSQPYVFEREPYCPLVNPPAGCQSGGTGNF